MISFVVPVKNDAVRLKRCLESIAAVCAAVPHEIIVADNGSTDGSSEVARAAGASVISLPGVRVSEMRNCAAAQARGPQLAFVDADHELAQGWADGGLDAMTDPAVVAAGAPCHPPANGTWVQRTYDRLRRHEPGVRETTWLGSGNMMVRTAAFTRVGGFDTSLETCEDVDLCQRLAASGGRLLETDRMRNIHYGDPATLRALFLGELWRGRDNLKVTFRGPLTPRALPSILLPIFNLFGLALFVAGLVVAPLAGAEMAAAGFVIVAAVTALRWMALVRQPRGAALSAGRALEALAVAATYTTARSLALVVRTGHDVRKRG